MIAGLLVGIMLASTTVLFRYEPPEVVVYVDPEIEVVEADAFIRDAVCPFITMGSPMPLPAPYVIQWRKPTPAGGMMPDGAKRVHGTLRDCPPPPERGGTRL